MAAVAVTNIYANLTFILYSTPKTIVADADGNTYNLNGISAANSQFYFHITDYNGDDVYKNPAFNATPDYTTPDVMGDAPLTWLNDTPVCPVDSDGSVVTGQYTVYIIQRDESQVVTDTFTQNFTTDYQYERVEMNLSRNIQLFNPPTLSVTDISVYSIADPLTSVLTAPTTNTRAWTLSYPPSSGYAPVRSTGPSVQTNDLVSGYYTAELASTLYYQFSTSQSMCKQKVYDTFTTTDDDIYIPDTSLGAMYCCLKHAEERYRNAIGTQNESSAKESWTTACNYKVMINTAIQYGSYDDVVLYINQMKEQVPCDDCDCDDDDAAIPLTGWGTQNIVGRIDEIAGGATATFPTAATDRARLQNKSYTDGDFIVFAGNALISNTGTDSTFTFNENTGAGVFNFTPSAGTQITFIFLK